MFHTKHLNIHQVIFITTKCSIWNMVISMSYSPHIRIKTNTRENWNSTKLKAQSKLEKELTNDIFTSLLLDCFNKYNENYYQNEKESIKIILEEN